VTDADLYSSRLFTEMTKRMAEMQLEINALQQQLSAVQAERESVSSQLWDCMNERDGLKARLADTAIGRSIETFTAAEHIAALVAMGWRERHGATVTLSSETFPGERLTAHDRHILIRPPEMRDA
jgi:hypothetical protein